MAYLNKVMLIGNIGKDPDIRMTANGRKRVSFSLATSRRYRDSSGETKENTDWHNIVGWGKIAEIIETLGVHKGMTLYVEGTLNYHSWDDPTSGQKRYMTDINMDTFQLLTPRNQGNYNNNNSYNRGSAPSYNNNNSYNRTSTPAQSQPSYNNNPQAQAQPNNAAQAPDDDDLPF